VNLLQVHVFLHRLRKELALRGELGYPTRFDSFVDGLFMLADESAKFRKGGIVHFKFSPLRVFAVTRHVPANALIGILPQ
jgi:hypothetical protein